MGLHGLPVLHQEIAAGILCVMEEMVEGNKALCQSKIDKNECYLAAMQDLEGTYEYRSAILKRSDDTHPLLDGASLIEQNVNRTYRVLDKLEEEGKLDGTGNESSITVGLPKRDPNKKNRGKGKGAIS